MFLCKGKISSDILKHKKQCVSRGKEEKKSRPLLDILDERKEKLYRYFQKHILLLLDII